MEKLLQVNVSFARARERERIANLRRADGEESSPYLEKAFSLSGILSLSSFFLSF